eukprot:gene26798-4389_t
MSLPSAAGLPKKLTRSEKRKIKAAKAHTRKVLNARRGSSTSSTRASLDQSQDNSCLGDQGIAPLLRPCSIILDSESNTLGPNLAACLSPSPHDPSPSPRPAEVDASDQDPVGWEVVEEDRESEEGFVLINAYGIHQ